MCLACAIPVRGRVLGSECLAEALGTEALPAADQPRPDPARRLRAATGAAFALGVGSTILPWSRFGIGSSAFGAWGADLRWSVFAAAAAVVGLAAWWIARASHDFGWPRAVDLALAVLAACLAASAVLAIVRPPPFARTWVGPWVALGAGLIGCTLSLAARRRRHVLSPQANVVDSA